jgi:hypothetical protein
VVGAAVALWKAFIVVAGLPGTNRDESRQVARVIEAILADPT